MRETNITELHGIEDKIKFLKQGAIEAADKIIAHLLYLRELVQADDDFTSFNAYFYIWLLDEYVLHRWHPEFMQKIKELKESD